MDTYELYYKGQKVSGGEDMSGGASQEIYSTEEQRIGTWIDGRPLYRKGITVENFSIVYMKYVDLCDREKIDSIISQKGDLATVDANSTPMYLSCSTGYTPVVAIGDVIKVYGNNFGGPVTGTFLIEYTKTTDQATIELPAMLTAEQPVVIAAAQSAASAELGSAGDSPGNEEV